MSALSNGRAIISSSSQLVDHRHRLGNEDSCVVLPCLAECHSAASGAAKGVYLSSAPSRASRFAEPPLESQRLRGQAANFDATQYTLLWVPSPAFGRWELPSNDTLTVMVTRRKLALAPHPAPGALRLIQDFVNTRQVGSGKDELSGPKELQAWLARHDLLTADAEIDETAWDQAMAIRELLRTVIRSHAGAQTGTEIAVRLNEAFGDGPVRLAFVDGDSMRFEPMDEGWPGALTRLRLILSREMAAGRWQRLKVCHAEDCQRVFYDRAKNRSGKWCQARRCAARLYSKAYRRRGSAGRRGRLTNSLIRG